MRDMAQRICQNRPEYLEIDRCGELFKRMALRRQLLQPILKIPQSALSLHHNPSGKSLRK